MASSKRLKLATRFQEIHSILLKSIDKECFIWKASDRKREKHVVTVLSIAPDKHTFAIRMKQMVQGINPGEIVFLKLGFRDSAIRAQVVERVGAKLNLEFPSQLALEENRRNPRFYFHASEDKTAQIRTPLRKDQEVGELLHSVLVCDISLGGIAVFVSSTPEKYFEVGLKLKLVALGIHRLGHVVKGEILFKVPHEIRGAQVNRTGFKLGIRFDHDIEQSTLDRFLIRGNMFRLSDEAIVGENFRNQVIAGIAEVRKILMERKQLREFFEAIEKSRIDTHYIKQHILLLSQVMAGIGTKLGWVSPRSIDKLIYVAYLHDLRLARHPHLARIPSKKVFDKRADSLSEAERTAYLEAPVFASEVAREDLEAYPDAIKILLQQRELPDGSGFPAGLAASAIAPLSALFIVCHLFVDYVIDHPDWSPADFVRSYQKVYRGQYFQKVFEAFLV